MLRRRLAALVLVPAIGLAAAVLTAPAALAQGQGTPPGADLFVTDNSGMGLNIVDNGHNEQATLGRGGTVFFGTNEETISGTTYWQFEDTNGLCLNDGIAGKVYLESCPVDSANELLSFTGSNGNELKFKQSGDVISSASVTSGAGLTQSSSTTPTAENQWEYSNTDPVETSIPVDFVQPTSADWTTIEDSAPQNEVPAAIFEVCQTVNGVFECGGANTQADTAWDSTIKALDKAGTVPLYYISTNYGQTSLTTIEQDAANALGWYSGTAKIGFLFDEVQGVATDNCAGPSGNISCQAYYQDLYDYVNGHGAGDLDASTVVMLNPGTPPTANYFGSGASGREIIQVFENTRSALSGFAMPSWTYGLPTDEFAATVSEESTANDQADINTLEADGVGNVYMTNETAPPDYDALPPFFASELAFQAAYAPVYSAGEVDVRS